jgi:hypothetical protein
MGEGGRGRRGTSDEGQGTRDKGQGTRKKRRRERLEGYNNPNQSDDN